MGRAGRVGDSRGGSATVSERSDPNISARRSESAFFVGPSGWSYPDWRGIVYPKRQGRSFDALTWISEHFNAVEVNASFYRFFPPSTTEKWVRRVGEQPSFRFAVKLHQSLTHDRSGDISGVVRAFNEQIAPLEAASRLGCVLAQFPWSFKCAPNALDWVHRLADQFAHMPLVAEFRHDSWLSDEAIQRLTEWGVGFCNIDQPALARCLGPTALSTGDVSYVRFHGRREDTWFSNDVARHERYNYLYTDDQLRGWVPRIRSLAESAREVYVFTNNHFQGKAPANALQLRALLEDRRVAVPTTMLDHFPTLKTIALPPDGSLPHTLF